MKTTLPPVNVLLVDDLEENLRALEALLSREGVELVRAKSGREALEVLLSTDVALVLLDVQMPEMDGFEVAELMRGTEKTRHVPIIFLTAGSHDAQRTFRGYDVGAVDFLYKPLDPVMLGHKVTVFVELHRRRLEREQLTNELQEVLRLNEMFVAALSHDLRSPLSAVSTGAALLQRSVQDAPGKRTLSRVSAAAQRMGRMLDQLYDLARARLGGGITVDRRMASLRRINEAAVEEARAAFPERTIEVEVLGTEGEGEGEWDAERMSQVLSNLIGNALRHGDRAHPVRVSLQLGPSEVAVEVHNGGVIPGDLLPHVFEPFRRGDAQPTDDSLGLGLYIARQIVEAHGGKLTARSVPEQGTTFRVVLPRAPEA